MTERINKVNQHVNPLPLLFHPSKVQCLPEYDFIVVGGGSSGCAVAARLAEKFPLKTVLLIEAGVSSQQFRISSPFLTCPDLQNSDLDFAYRTTPQALQQNRKSYWPRAKVLGGCSSMNFMLAVRGDSRGYDKWAKEMGCPGWSFAEVEPYFCKLENYTGKSQFGIRGRQGPVTITDNRDLDYLTKPTVQAFIDGCEEVGLKKTLDYNQSQEGAGHSQTTIDQGKRCDTSTAYLFGPQGAFARCSNLHCVTEKHVARIVFKGKQAVGVVLVEGNVTISSRKEVILCAGAIGSAQILLLSGVGPQSHLQKMNIPVVQHLPGVGQNLKDHIMLSQLYEMKPSCSSKFSDEDPLTVASQLARYGLTRSGIFATSWVQGMALFDSKKFQSKSDANAIQIHMVPFISRNEEPLKKHFGFDREHFTMGTPTTNKYVINFLPSLLQPKSAGFLELLSNDPMAHPLIEPRYLDHPDDVGILLEAWNFVKSVTKSKAMQHVVAKAVVDDSIPFPVDSDEYAIAKIKRDVITIYHPCCTCKMGPQEDPMAVLDPKTLRVWNTVGLRVADCSSFPDIPAANTNLPAIMIGERCADFIFREEC